MRWIAVIGLLVFCCGCHGGIPQRAPEALCSAAGCQNPLFLANPDHETVWETTVDVVDDYFKIEREDPVRKIGAVLTEGRIDTFPKIGSTLFEPWHGDSVGTYEKLESTLQSIRRRAEVKVTPGQGGYWVEVAVFKELEDVVRPTRSTAGSATFRSDGSLTRVVGPVGDQEVHEGWIRRGRDMALEQRILEQLQSRLGTRAQCASPAMMY